MIDLGWLNVNQPIDLTAICNTKVYKLDVSKNHCGVQLTDDVSMLANKSYIILNFKLINYQICAN